MASTSDTELISDFVINLEVLHVFVVEILQIEHVKLSVFRIAGVIGLALLAKGFEILLDPFLDFLLDERSQVVLGCRLGFFGLASPGLLPFPLGLPLLEPSDLRRLASFWSW